MEREVEEVVGPKGKHDRERTAKRHGHEDGSMTLGGRRVPVRLRELGDEALAPPVEQKKSASSIPSTLIPTALRSTVPLLGELRTAGFESSAGWGAAAGSWNEYVISSRGERVRGQRR